MTRVTPNRLGHWSPLAPAVPFRTEGPRPLLSARDIATYIYPLEATPVQREGLSSAWEAILRRMPRDATAPPGTTGTVGAVDSALTRRRMLAFHTATLVIVDGENFDQQVYDAAFSADPGACLLGQVIALNILSENLRKLNLRLPEDSGQVPQAPGVTY